MRVNDKGSYLNEEEFLNIINKHCPPKCTNKNIGRYVQEIKKEEIDYILTTYFQDVLEKYWVGSYVRSETYKDKDSFHPYLKTKVRKIMIKNGFSDRKYYWKRTLFL